MLRLRNLADYSEKPISKKVAAWQLGRAVDLIGAISQELQP
jgi:hypothetical protein